MCLLSLVVRRGPCFSAVVLTLELSAVSSAFVTEAAK